MLATENRNNRSIRNALVFPTVALALALCAALLALGSVAASTVVSVTLDESWMIHLPLVVRVG